MNNQVKKKKMSKKRREKIIKARFRFATICLILITCVMVYKNKQILDEASQKVTSSSNGNQEYINNIKTAERPVSKLDTIINNREDYTEGLIELATKHEETIDFVYNYPKNKDKDFKINPNDFKKNEDGIKLFIQWDERWGYKQYGDDFMALTGCAPTSLAMVVSSLNNDKSVTPIVIAKYAEENNFYVDGIGSSWSLINDVVHKYGLRSNAIPSDANMIIGALEGGNPIIASVGPGTFTETGHFIVLTGVTNEGKIRINDPNSNINSEKEWDIEVFLNESQMMWEIIK